MEKLQKSEMHGREAGKRLGSQVTEGQRGGERSKGKLAGRGQVVSDSCENEQKVEKNK